MTKWINRLTSLIWWVQRGWCLNETKNKFFEILPINECYIWARVCRPSQWIKICFTVSMFICDKNKEFKQKCPLNQSLHGVGENIDGRHHFPFSINIFPQIPFNSFQPHRVFIYFSVVFFLSLFRLNRNLHTTLRSGQCVCDYVISISGVMISIRFFIYWANCGGECWWIETRWSTTNAACIRQ